MLIRARSNAELTTQAARREVNDLTRQKDAVTNQLSQMLSGLSGLVPTVGGAAAKAAETVQQGQAPKQAEAPAAEAPAQRAPEGGADADQPEVAAKTS